ncbi:hypothetical protein TCAL_09418 [Tigriopus californicus]|uniref:Uncharacterized protein n=1 Tax=Tigriopus californicus TaxID=6832 RepID=A0A553NY48_TIGCA|nr:uncharacterized protein LOC131887357 [Tigriopus californicus]TRY70350.1 hypothetical protein TCAL_09418 [Tigriopus californicus]|eukprot:TCALIF_09418-PA protein Name:"Protein of unknown function" AED:0.00 eAED:0.00 QI:349/1/1/1/0.66/0.5/4/589/134
MILGHGANTMTLEEARLKLCAQAKLMGKECNPSLLTGALQHHYHGHDDVAAQQSKDAIIYVTIVVVFYVAIVLLLIGTNLRAGRANRTARFKKHVVEYSEGSGRAENRLVAEPPIGSRTNGSMAIDYDEEIADV